MASRVRAVVASPLRLTATTNSSSFIVVLVMTFLLAAASAASAAPTPAATGEGALPGMLAHLVGPSRPSLRSDCGVRDLGATSPKTLPNLVTAGGIAAEAELSAHKPLASLYLVETAALEDLVWGTDYSRMDRLSPAERCIALLYHAAKDAAAAGGAARVASSEVAESAVRVGLAARGRIARPAQQYLDEAKEALLSDLERAEEGHEDEEVKDEEAEDVDVEDHGNVLNKDADFANPPQKNPAAVAATAKLRRALSPAFYRHRRLARAPRRTVLQYYVLRQPDGILGQPADVLRQIDDILRQPGIMRQPDIIGQSDIIRQPDILGQPADILKQIDDILRKPDDVPPVSPPSPSPSSSVDASDDTTVPHFDWEAVSEVLRDLDAGTFNARVPRDPLAVRGAVAYQYLRETALLEDEVWGTEYSRLDRLSPAERAFVGHYHDLREGGALSADGQSGTAEWVREKLKARGRRIVRPPQADLDGVVAMCAELHARDKATLWVTYGSPL